MAGVNRDAMAIQVGQTGGGFEEEFFVYETLMNPALLSRAVTS
jgi:hypothetical protein